MLEKPVLCLVRWYPKGLVHARRLLTPISVVCGLYSTASAIRQVNEVHHIFGTKDDITFWEWLTVCPVVILDNVLRHRLLQLDLLTIGNLDTDFKVIIAARILSQETCAILVLLWQVKALVKWRIFVSRGGSYCVAGTCSILLLYVVVK